MRWIVERKPQGLEDVGADRFEVTPGGGLRFTNTRTQNYFEVTDEVITYAPGQWLTVVPEAE